MTGITVESGNSTYDSRNNCNAIIETESNTLIAGCKNTVIPNSVTSIGNSAFTGCSGLTSITIPNSLTSIGNIAFSGCSNLTGITIPNSVTSIGSSAFSSCSSLIGITIPDRVTSIGNDAFYYCKGLTNITIPNSVTSIGNYAFSECSELADCYVNWSEPLDISSSSVVFGSSNQSNATLHVPVGTKSLYEAADVWKYFGTIVEVTPELIEIADGTVYSSPSTFTTVVKYTRNFGNTNWQSLYVPFSIPVQTLTDNGLVVAELNDTHQWDLNGDGVADSTRIEFFTLNSGETQANYPYLIKATSPVNVVLNLEDVLLKAAEDVSIDCSSIKQKFTFVGTYAGVSGADMYNNNYYGMAGGGLKRVSGPTVSLKPQRWYMKIENRNGSPVQYFAPSIRFSVDGIEEEPEVTDLRSAVVIEESEEPIYSLDGIRHNAASAKSGIYVQNGKKVIVR